ncbi:MAG TPA: LAGLIDADG family homing endonuclease [Herpetosiphonaceae bacterium]
MATAEQRRASAAKRNGNGQATPPKAVLNELGEKIFLDRYALKDMTKKSLAVGDTVIVCVNQKTRQREIGTVRGLSNGRVSIELRDGTLTEQGIEDVDKPLETKPEQMMERVARGIAAIETVDEKQREWEQKFRWLLDDWRFVPGGRILTAAGTDQQLTFYNCYVVPSPHDSRRGIVDTLSQMMEIMSRGGGVGINISTLRPRHAYVQGVNGRSSGSVSWGGLYSFVTGLIEQGGSRRGALMLILNVWHPDVVDFINAKREMGKITNANISVGITDPFMDAVKADADWDLVFPDPHHPDYDTGWTGDIEAWQSAGRPVVVHKTVKAREIWNNIIESAWASAEPGMWFIDRANKMSNSFYFSPLICTNPCHSGKNLVHTRTGLIPIKDLVGTEFEVVSDLRTLGGEGVHYERAVAYPTGVKKLYKLTLDTGHSIELTENHRVFTQRGKVEVKDLHLGEDEVWLQSAPHIDALLQVEDKDVRKGRVLGWNAGDGWISQFPETRQGSGVNVGFIFNQQEELARDYVLDFVHETSSGSRTVNPRLNQGCWEIQASNQGLVDFFSSYGVSPKQRKRVTSQIFSAPIGVRIGFLQGLFSADGSVDCYRNKSGNNSIILISSHKGLAYGVQVLLSDLGIKSYVRTRKEKGVPYVTRDGELRISNANLAYALRITRDDIHRFHRLIGFALSPQKQASLEETMEILQAGKQFKSYPYSKVISIEPLEEEPVYNVTTDISHSLVVNGVVLANCGEQPLPAFGICNLGALNLSRFAYNGEVLWDDLRQAVRYAVRFLDNVIDATPYFFEENKAQQGRERRVGLGIMGLADMLIRLKIRYGSDECLTFLDQLGEVIATEAYLASSANAAEKGAFPMFDAEKLLQSGYMQAMPEHVRQTIREQGLRNVTLLTVAPTGTTGTMVGTSTGVEPYFSWSYFRKSRLGVHEERVAVVEEWERENPGQSLPDYFINAMELAPTEHVNVQAALQRWIDSAISKTANVPNEYTVEQTRELYEYMYQLGCKGGTIYRDGSRDEQVLNLKKEEKKAEPQPAAAATAKHTLSELWNMPKIRPRPKRTRGETIKQSSPLGAIYVTLNDDDEGEPLEIFITAGKAGSDVTSMADALGRLASLVLRVASPVTPKERLIEIITQLKGIGGASSMGFGKNRVRSLPDAVAQALEECCTDTPIATEPTDEGPVQVQLSLPTLRADLCPSCGEAAFVHEEGCMHCNACGYSKC